MDQRLAAPRRLGAGGRRGGGETRNARPAAHCQVDFRIAIGGGISGRGVLRLCVVVFVVVCLLLFLFLGVRLHLCGLRCRACRPRSSRARGAGLRLTVRAAAACDRHSVGDGRAPGGRVRGSERARRGDGRRGDGGRDVRLHAAAAPAGGIGAVAAAVEARTLGVRTRRGTVADTELGRCGRRGCCCSLGHSCFHSCCPRCCCCSCGSFVLHLLYLHCCEQWPGGGLCIELRMEPGQLLCPRQRQLLLCRCHPTQ